MIPATDCVTHSHDRDHYAQKCIVQSQVHDQVIAVLNKMQA